MAATTSKQICWTSADLELFPENDWKRYEVVDGELLVTRAPHLGHQDSAGLTYARLLLWSEETGLGKPFLAPGVVFSDMDDVIPDVVWVQKERLPNIVDESGHFTEAPDLVIEVLSAGTTNERRDREIKLRLYSLKGVKEYWILNWRLKQIEIYRRDNFQLQLKATLLETDTITSPLLPDFNCLVKRCF